MAQVPYTGVPDVAPQLNALPHASVDTPPAAFGGTVAAAVEHMGDVAQGAGKEIFQRAYGFQELDQQFKADNAASNTTDAQTQIYLDYDKKKGQERVDAFPQYVKDLEQARQDGAQSLNSIYAKQKYLDESRKGQSQMIWHGGTLARQGQDELANSTYEAGMNAAVRRYGTLDTNNPADYANTRDAIKDNAEQQLYHAKNGPTPGTPEAAEAALPVISNKMSQVILGKINGANPPAAKPLIEQAVKDGVLTDEAADVLRQKADYAINGKLGRTQGSQIGAGTVGQNPREVADRAEAAADKIDKGNVILKDNMRDAALERQQHETSLAQAGDNHTWQVLRTTIDGSDPDTGGKVPLSMDEALQNPKFADQYNSLATKPEGAMLQAQVREQIRKNNTTDGWVTNMKGTGQFNEMMTKLTDPRASADDIDSVINANLLSTQMNKQQRTEIAKLVDSTLKAQSTQPNINSAMQLPSVRTALSGAGLTKGTPEYDEFAVEFGKAVKSYTEGKHATVKDDDQLGKIADKMLLHQSSSWLHPGTWGTNTSPAYKDPYAAIPGLKAQALREYKDSHGGAEPSPEFLDAMAPDMLSRYFKTLGKQSRPGTTKPGGQ